MITFDEEPIEHSVAFLTSGSVFTALIEKLDKRDVDEQVVQASENLITSGAVHVAIQEAVQTATVSNHGSQLKSGETRYEMKLQEIRYYNGLHWVDYKPVSSNILSTLSWQQKGDDFLGLNAGDSYGSSMSMSADGKTIAIGVPFFDGENGLNSGRVSIYSLNESNGLWERLGNEIDGDAEGDRSGSSLALSANGKTVAIGAPKNSSSKGRIRVFSFTNGSWFQLGNEINGDANNDESGFSVALSADGKIVAIGAPKNSNSKGRVRVFTFTNESWPQLGNEINGDANNERCGYTVSLSANGKTVAIGAPAYNNSTGRVRVFTFENETTWTQLGGDINGYSEYNLSGYSVSLSGDGKTVAFGAPFTSSDKGHVRVYLFVNGSWNLLGNVINGEAIGDQSGTSISLSTDGKTIVIGAINRSFGELFNRGHFRVFRFFEESWIKVGQEVFGQNQNENFGHTVAISADGYTVTASSIAALNYSGIVRVYSVL